MHGKQYDVRILARLARRPGARLALGLTREPFQLLLAARIAEDHLVPGAREDGAELSAHQSGTEHADAHDALLT